MTSVALSRTAQSLGHLGLLPFFALAMLAWLPAGAKIGTFDAAPLAQLALVAYAAVILSFLGAVHWGFALSQAGLALPVARRSLFWGVVPSLLGWLALLMMFVGIRASLVFVFLIVDLLLARLMDGALLRLHPSFPGSYLELRTRLTAGAVLALLIACVASW